MRWRRALRNTKLFSSKLIKINFTLAIFFLLFLSVFSIRFSYADTCLPGAPDWVNRVVLPPAPRACPNSGFLCTYGIMENKYDPAWCCHGINLFTVISPCRIRASEEPIWIYWNWPEPIGDTLRGPCFPVVGSAPCGSPNEITIWYQWVEPIGTEEACDPSDCFFCKDNIDGRPDCGLENSRCPD